MTGSSSILVVDDDPGFRDFVATLLGDAGYAVSAADSGEAALVAVGDRRPDLVMLDVSMPGMSGYEVCRALRTRFGERLPVIFVSGTRVEPYDRAGGLMIGADDYVVKPCFGDELLARVRRLLVRSGSASQAAVRRGAANLTPREQEVLQLLARGLSQQAIAEELHISGKTVAAHIQRILVKLGVHSRAEAVAYAFRNALVGADLHLHALAAARRRG